MNFWEVKSQHEKDWVLWGCCTVWAEIPDEKGSLTKKKPR